MVLAAATGQRAALESIELIQTRNGWRLASLGLAALDRSTGVRRQFDRVPRRVGGQQPEADHVLALAARGQ